MSFAPVEEYLLGGSCKDEVGTTENSFPKSLIMGVTLIVFLSIERYLGEGTIILSLDRDCNCQLWALRMGDAMTCEMSLL